MSTRQKFYPVVFFIIALVGLCVAQETDRLIKVSIPKIKNIPLSQMHNDKKKVNLDLDKKVVIKLAEIILENKYGEKVLKQKPWIVSENNDSFKIIGTFHGEPGTKGGVVDIVISKSDARVLSITHGK